MTYLNDRGSVTAFICVLVPVLILSSVAICDACLFKSGRSIIEDSAESALYTVMGKYSSYLKDNYDIYAFNASNGTEEASACENLLVNLGDSRLYDFAVEDIMVSFGKPITDPGTAYGLIMKAAPDDVYQSLVDEFTERFGMLSGMTGAAEIISLKMKLDDAYREIRTAMEKLEKIINGGEGIEYFINMLESEIGFSAAIDEFNGYCKQIEEIENRIKKLISEADGEQTDARVLLEERAGMLREKAAEIYDSFIEGIIRGIKDACREAVGEIRDIILANEKIHMISDALKSRISNMENCPVYIKEILVTCTKILADTEEAFVEQVFEEIRIEVEKNLDSLKNLERNFTEVIENGGTAAERVDYNSAVCYSAPESEPAGKGEDRRSFFEGIGKRVLEKQVGKDIFISRYRVLPSGGTESEDKGFDVSSTGTDTSSGNGAVDEFGDSVRILDSLILNEYILQRFFNHTTQASDKSRYSYLESETEYILWGMRSGGANVFSTKAAVMTTRFALDAIHVYTDSEKSALADGIAAATAGWWTFGAGIPVMSNLVKISWAIAEAGLDTRRLCNGESIAVIKTSGDWMTDIGIPGTEIKSPDFLKMDYMDYLRLYLAAVPRETKILRLLDLVDLNAPADFDIFGTYAEVSVTATVSFRSLTGGRHVVEVIVTDSY